MFTPVVADDSDVEVQVARLWARLALVKVVANQMECPDERPGEVSEKILKLYDAGLSGGGGITGRPWEGSLHTIRGAPGSLKHVQPALISWLGVKPSALAAVTIPNEKTTATINRASLLTFVSLPQKMPPVRSTLWFRRNLVNSVTTRLERPEQHLGRHSRTLAQSSARGLSRDCP